MTTRLMYWALFLAALALAASGCPSPTEDTAPPIPGMEMPSPAPTRTATDEEGQEMSWTITSTAFTQDGTIPKKYTADGENVSPPLSFSGVPQGTAEIALICHDPDAPRQGGFTHWVVYGMSPDTEGLPEAVPARERVGEPKLVQGLNDAGSVGYRGPSPPAGFPHHYHFQGYALSEALDLRPGATEAKLRAAMEGKIIGEALLVGLYGR